MKTNSSFSPPHGLAAGPCFGCRHRSKVYGWNGKAPWVENQNMAFDPPKGPLSSPQSSPFTRSKHCFHKAGKGLFSGLF